jgi:biopolymer transport protein ExbD
MSGEFILPRRKRRIRPYLDLTALIDTVFNLLIFFALTTTFAGGKGLPLHLPNAASVQPVNARIVLNLQPNQPVFINGQAVALEQLGASLNNLSGGNLDTQIIIQADQLVPYSQLVAALDEVRLAGYSRLALAAKEKPKASASPAH